MSLDALAHGSLIRQAQEREAQETSAKKYLHYLRTFIERNLPTLIQNKIAQAVSIDDFNFPSIIQGSSYSGIKKYFFPIPPGISMDNLQAAVDSIGYLRFSNPEWRDWWLEFKIVRRKSWDELEIQMHRSRFHKPGCVIF